MRSVRQVSVVVATRNRSQLACDRAIWALAQASVTEAIFVVDGAEDDTAADLRRIAETDPRLRVIELHRNVGPPKARNIGVRAAACDWVLVIDDDDHVSPDFIDVLLQVADEADADVVGVPWFHLESDEDIDQVLGRAPRTPGGPALDRPGIVPEEDWVESVWIHANTLFRRSVFEKVSYDEHYVGNYYRDETDLFVSLARAGFRVVVTSRGYTYMRTRSSGGIDHGAKLLYEYWALANNWRFLNKHGAWLRERGLLESKGREQLAFAGRRARPIVRSVIRRATAWGRPS
jgi:GT2 family glycosyltransferase